MSKSKNVTVSKQQLTETGEEMEVAGAVAQIAGMAEVAEGLDDLAVAQQAVRVGVSEVAAGSSDLTRAADAAHVAKRMRDLSEIVAAAGVVDVAEGVDMLLKGGDVRAMGDIVGLMSKEELERGLELARLAGELWTVSDVVSVLQMPVLADFLEERGMHLQEIAVDQLLRFTGTRALAGAIKQTGKDIEVMGKQEMAEGVVRMAVSEAAAGRSAELSAASDALAAQAVHELDTAQVAAAVAQGAVAAGVTEVAESMVGFKVIAAMRTKCRRLQIEQSQASLMQVERPKELSDVSVAPHRHQQTGKRIAGASNGMLIKGRFATFNRGAGLRAQVFQPIWQQDLVGELVNHGCASRVEILLANRSETKSLGFFKNIDEQ